MDTNEYFTMPLDSLDLKSLLHLQAAKNWGWMDDIGIKKNHTNVIPIWSKKPVMATDDYYEFEIKCLSDTENKFDQNGCSKKDENTEHCYICDIAVPSGYMQIHNTGIKHRTSAAIISHALHRANQQMTHTSLANTDAAPASLSHKKKHYCDQCSTLINIEDRNNHEITEAHMKAVKYDRQLQDFLALFTDKVVIENYNYNNDMRNDENDNTNGKSKYKENQKSNTLNVEEETTVEENIEAVEEETYRDKPYKAATDDYNEDFVLLKTMKGESVCIPTDNYQGFSRSANGIQCRVCREMVVDTAAHRMQLRHIELVTAPITDCHCIRPLTAVLNHCILCNEIVGDPLSHIFNNQHCLFLKQYIVPSSEKEANFKNIDDHYCNYCNLIVEKAQKKQHKNSLDHRMKMWNAHTKMHHHLKATEVLCEILCRVCNIVIQNQQECLDEHLQTFDHEKNYEALLTSNKIRKTGDCLSFCQICNIRLVDKEELHHIVGAKHVAKLLKWQESVLLDSKKERALLQLKKDETVCNSDISDESDEMDVDDINDMVFEKTQPNYMIELSTDDQVKCKVCDVKIENDIDVIKKHMETNNHKFNYDTILNYNKVIAIESSDEFKFYCEYCKVQVKEKSEIDHINDYLHSCERDFIKQLQHLKGQMSDDKDLDDNTKQSSHVNDDSKDTENCDRNANATKNAYYCDICNIDLENINNVKAHYESETHKNNLDKTFIEQPKEIHYLMEVKNKTFQCKVCRVKVPNNVQNIKNHIDGRNHNRTYNFLLNFNKIKKTPGSFHCEICKETVTETMEIDHINSSNHIKMRSNNKKVVAVVKTDEVKNNTDKLNSIKDYYCDVCEVGVLNYPHNIREHTSGLRHKANIDKIVSNNNISMKKKNTYYCDLCNTYFSKASVVKHVQSEKHKFLQSK